MKFQELKFLLIKLFKEYCFIITAPNMDTQHNQIIYKLKNFAKSRDNIYYFKSLGKKNILIH